MNRPPEWNEKLKTLLLNGGSTMGADAEGVMNYICESLTHDEYKLGLAFLTWVWPDKGFGHGNIDQRFDEFMEDSHMSVFFVTRDYNLPCYGIEVKTDKYGGAIISDLKTVPADVNDPFNRAMDGVESLILAAACEGIDIESPAFVKAVETAVEAIGNNT